MSFIKALIYILLKALEHIHICYFEVLVLCFGCIPFSGPAPVQLLASGRGILFWQFMFVVLCWDPGIWSYDVWGVLWCRCQALSLLGGCCVLWLLLLTLDPRQGGGCGVPVKGASVGVDMAWKRRLYPSPLGPRLKCFYRLLADTKEWRWVEASPV